MASRTKNVKQLVKESLQVGLDDFAQLTDHVARMLGAEDGRVGNLHVSHRLIEVPAEGEAIVIGDLHGDLETLAQILEISDFVLKAERSENALLLFLGDYGDRGIFSPEVYHIVLTLKATFPERVILMRGNHEGPDDLMASPHDLPVYLHNRFGEGWARAYVKLKELFKHLYNAVRVENRCVLLHGGVPSHASSLDDLACAHLKHPQETHLEEILWSDPEEGLRGTCPSPRGAGRLFGQDVSENFLEMLEVKVLIRGHEPAETGFKINHGGRILTLFSRKGEPYLNTQGAFLQLNLADKIEDAIQLTRFMKQL